MPPVSRWPVVFACLLPACSRETAPGKPAHAAELPSARATVAARANDAPPPGAEAKPPPHVLMLQTDAGLVPAAKATRVLHVGDSMAPLVGNYLRPIFTRSGRNYWIDAVISSSTLDWAEKRLLQDAMYRYDPEVVVISLGSNELFDPTPERRAGSVRQIVEDTRGRPCLWVGPPLWKRDLGFIDVLKKNLGHCRYFDSSKLELARMPDGRHPSWNGGWHWADAVWHVLGGTEPVPTGNPQPAPELKPE
jgi:hypothetical protein